MRAHYPARPRLPSLCLILMLALVTLQSPLVIAEGGLRRVGKIAEVPTDYNDRWAVIIGVDTYADSSFRRLNFAVNDAQAVRDLLVNEYGFPEKHVRLLLKTPETSAQSIRAVFEHWLPSQGIASRDAVLVFYAGHGFLSRDGRGGYIAAADTRIDGLESSAISVDWLHTQLNRLRTAGDGPEQIHKLLILDSCYSGSLFENVRRSDVPTRQHLSDNGYAQHGPDRLSFYLRQPAFFAMSAGRLTPVADDSSDRAHSIFTSALLSVLRERADSARADHAFTFRQLAIHVESRVMNALGSQQVPDWGPVEPSDGDFVFRPHPARNALGEALAPWSGDNRITPSESRKLAGRRQRYALDMASAWELFERGDIREVTKLLDQQLPDPGQPDVRAFDWYHLFRMCHAERLRVSVPGDHGAEVEVLSASLSPDGRLLAASVGSPFTKGPCTIHVWDVSSGNPTHLFARHHPTIIRALSFSRDNRWLAAGWLDDTADTLSWTRGGALLWRVDKDAAAEPEMLPGDAGVLSLTFSPDSHYLAASSTGHEPAISVWSLSGRRTTPTRLKGSAIFESVGFSPDGKMLRAGDMDGVLWRWSLPTGQRLGVHRYGPVHIALPSSGQMMALVDNKRSMGRVSFVDLARRTKAHFEFPSTQRPEGVVFSVDGLRALILLEGSAGVVSMDPQSGRVLDRLLGPGSDLDPWGHGFASKTFVTFHGLELLIWDVEHDVAHSRFRALSAKPTEFPWHALSADARWLAIADVGATISLWDLRSGKRHSSLALPADSKVLGLTFSTSGSMLAVGDLSGSDERLWLYELSTGTRRLLAPNRNGAPMFVESLAFSPDDQLLLTVNVGSGSYEVWSTSSGERLGHSEGRGGVPTVAGHYGFVPKGHTVFMIDSHNQFLETDLSGKQTLRQFQPFAHMPESQSMFTGASAISGDGRLWAAGFPNGSFGIIDLTNPDSHPTVSGQHFKGIADSIFDPAVRTLATGSEDGAVRLWLPSGEPLHELRRTITGAVNYQDNNGTSFGDGYGTRIRGLAFSADGSALVALAEPGDVETWHAASDEEVVARAEHASRFGDLTQRRLTLVRSYWALAIRDAHARTSNIEVAAEATRKALALMDQIERDQPGILLADPEWRSSLQALLRFLQSP